MTKPKTHPQIPKKPTPEVTPEVKRKPKPFRPPVPQAAPQDLVKASFTLIKKSPEGQMLSAAEQRRAFEAELNQEMPSLATILGRLYRAAANLTTRLDEPELSVKDQTQALAQLAKTLPLLQQAESNYVAKFEEKRVEDLTNAELEERVARYLAGKVIDVNVEEEE